MMLNSDFVKARCAINNVTEGGGKKKSLRQNISYQKMIYSNRIYILHLTISRHKTIAPFSN